MSTIKVGALQDLSGNTDFDLINNIINTTSLNTTNINGIAASNIFVPAGTIIFHSASSAPPGYIKANGAAVLRASYPALFTAIGTIFGAGDGSTTFNIPDLRGVFLRCWSDNSTAIDSKRIFGSFQVATKVSDQPFFNDSLQNGENGVSFSSTAFAFSNPYTNTKTFYDVRPGNIALLACIKF